MGKIGNKTRNKSFVTVVLSLAFIAAYYAVYMNANKLLSKILANSGEYSAKIKGAAYPLYSIGRAATGDGLQLAFVAAGTLIISLAVWLVLERTFIGIVTTKAGHTKRKNNKSCKGAEPGCSTSSERVQKTGSICRIYAQLFPGDIDNDRYGSGLSC